MRSVAFVSLLGLLLTACGPTKYIYVVQQADLPAIPSDIANCFSGSAVLPAETEWSAELTANTLTNVRISELHKNNCGKRFLAFYEGLAADRPMGPR